MKVEDLMIGDWYYWEADGKKYPLQVTKDTFKLSDADISNFQSVLLTTETLEKNGFKKHISNTRMFYHHDEYRLSYYLVNKHFTIYNQINGSLVQRVITYVHELQHVLKLCGINKEIKL